MSLTGTAVLDRELKSHLIMHKAGNEVDFDLRADDNSVYSLWKGLPSRFDMIVDNRRKGEPPALSRAAKNIVVPSCRPSSIHADIDHGACTDRCRIGSFNRP